ncbi:MAG: hypothetical protein OXJ53_16360 [Gammaproteobacteria bacterium]|nr:hypothetical protein [Gammaproteobacteria bacterium]
MLDAPRVPDAALLGAWRAAKASDIEPEVTIAWFPAWMLLAEPGLARVLDFAGGKQPPDRAFDLLKALLTSDRGASVTIRSRSLVFFPVQPTSPYRSQSNERARPYWRPVPASLPSNIGSRKPMALRKSPTNLDS